MNRLRVLGWVLVGLILIGLSCSPLDLVSKSTGSTSSSGSGVASSAASENPPPSQKSSSAASVNPPPSQKSSSAQTQTAQASASSADASTSVKAGKVGQRIVGDNLAITVTKAEINKGTADIKPAQGNTYVVIYFVLENASKNRLMFYPDSFEIKDSNGRLITNTWLDFLKDQLEIGQYAPGGKTTATIAFEVSQKSNGFHLLVDQGNDTVLDVDLGF